MELLLAQSMPIPMYIPISTDKTYREKCYEQCHYTTLESSMLREVYRAECVNACEDNKPIEYTDEGFTIAGGIFSFFLVGVILVGIMFGFIRILDAVSG